MITLGQALVELGIGGWEFTSVIEPTSESEFNASFRKITATDSDSGKHTYSTNPSDFGVTWTQLKAKYDEMVSAEPLKEVREVRDRLLTESDWTRMDDNGLSDSAKASWATYRQELRDITDNATSLDDVTWPTKP